MAAMVLGLTFVIPFQTSGANESSTTPPASSADELQDQLEDLAKRVTQLESAKLSLEIKVKTQGELLGEIYGWMRTLPAASEALRGSLETAKKNGFAKAGPNPRAKNNLLDGLKEFAKALSASNPAKPKTPKKK